MVPGPLLIVFFVLGAVVGSLLCFGLTKHDIQYQFKKDCVSMAHGTVDKSAKNICVKDGKILFHQ